ncbi:MAG: hypothetical protein LBL59_04995 [Xanthomonadaceae bacterium]|nr:hypothetical protein [Xanthomonadaceae bacterium]
MRHFSSAGGAASEGERDEVAGAAGGVGARVVAGVMGAAGVADAAARLLVFDVVALVPALDVVAAAGRALEVDVPEDG